MSAGNNWGGFGRSRTRTGFLATFRGVLVTFIHWAVFILELYTGFLYIQNYLKELSTVMCSICCDMYLVICTVM